MYRSALRPSNWRILPTRPLNVPTPNFYSRRYQSITARSKSSRPWKSALLRWAAVAGGVYYYSKSELFAEELEVDIGEDNRSSESTSDMKNITINAILERKNQHESSKLAEEQIPVEVTNLKRSESQTLPNNVLDHNTGEGAAENDDNQGVGSREGAFDPETGKINWDCPCLGGMADGPCGEEFKGAFSCFVYSNEEPKGAECIEKFKTMQNCFRQYPDIYGSELDDDKSESERISGEEATQDPENALQSIDQSQQISQSSLPSAESKSLLAQAAVKENENSDMANKTKDKSSTDISNITSS